jgi:hypothetical protein
MDGIFWTSGIGDIIALEATMTDEYRNGITRMYWASRSSPQMLPLFAKLPSFPYLADQISLSDALPLSGVNIEHAYDECKHLMLGDVEDWSPCRKFCDPQTFNYSSFVRYNLANIERFKLPADYIVVCPYSSIVEKEVQEWRRFTNKDWVWLLNHLEDVKAYGIVLNVGNDFVPENRWLINLSNETNLGEAIEITKQASGYIGIGMAFSVLAAQMLPSDKIIVSITDDFALYVCKHIYYAPKTEFDFLVPHLGATGKEIEEWKETMHGQVNIIRRQLAADKQQKTCE